MAAFPDGLDGLYDLVIALTIDHNAVDESKALSEQIIMNSGLPYLIIRGHRFVGINKTYSKPKQFPDALKALFAGQEIHLDSKKLFKPTFINNICGIFAHYIEHDATEQIMLNIGIDKAWKGTYSPGSKTGRASVMRDRVESINSPAVWSYQ